MAFLSTPTGVVLIDSRNASGTITIPLSTEIPGRTIVFKDAYGSFSSNILYLSTSDTDLFENGSNLLEVNTTFGSVTLFAGNGVWYQIATNTKIDTITPIFESTIQGLGTASYISSFLPIEEDLISTVSGLGSAGFLSSVSALDNEFISTIDGLGSAGYISSIVSTFSELNTSSLKTNTIVLGEPSVYDWVTTGDIGCIYWSKDGLSWTAASNVNGYTAVYSIIKVSTLWYAAGYDTSTGIAIKYSEDGFTWSNTCNGGFGDNSGVGTNIQYNGTIFVATGNCASVENNSTIIYSYDGMNWSNSDSGFQNVSDIHGTGSLSAYGNDVWVAVGFGTTSNNVNYGTIKYSPDGIHWSNATNSFVVQGYSVKFANGMFVAGGYHDYSDIGLIKYSYNGITWYNTCNVVNGGVAHCINYINNTWYAVTNAYGPSFLHKSLDGIHWDILSTSNLPAVTYSFDYNPNTKMFIASGNYYNSPPPLSYSYDLCNFTPVLSNGSPFYGVGITTSFIGQKLLTLSDSKVGEFLINDEIPWERNLVSTTKGINTNFNNSNNILSNSLILQNTNSLKSTVSGLGSASYISTLIDIQTSSINFTFEGFAIDIQTSLVQGNTIFYNGENKWLVGGRSGLGNTSQIAVSSDGYRWSSANANSVIEVNDIAYNGSNLYVLGATASFSTYDTLQTSPNGITWTPWSGGGGGGAFFTVVFGVAYLSNIWFVAGFPGTIKYGTDGINWGDLGTPFTIARSIAYNGSNRFVAVGYTDNTPSNTIITYDAIPGGYTAQSNNLIYPTKVKYANGIFIACGTPDTGHSGVIASTDGSNWVESSPAFVPNDIYYNSNNGFWYAVGGSNLWESTDGSNWSSPATIPFTDARSLTYADGRYIFVGSNAGTSNGSIQMGHTPSTLFYANDRTYLNAKEGLLYLNNKLYGVQSNDLFSTTAGLGTTGYISSIPQVLSVSSINAYSISTVELIVTGASTLTVTGNTAFFQDTTVNRLYASSITNQSTIQFIDQAIGAEIPIYVYNQSLHFGSNIITSVLDLTSTTAGLGSADYVSTASLTSTVTDIYSAWNTYSVSWTGETTNPSLGDGTLNGRYKTHGKTVFFFIELVIGTTTTLGTGAWRFSLPVNGYDPGCVIAPCTLLRNGHSWYEATALTRYFGDTSYVTLIAHWQNQTATVKAGYPFHWANTDVLSINGTYESA